jgi:ribosomal protein L16/L10AE
MGKGRGGFHCEKSPTRPGQVLCEFSGLDISVARQLHRSLSKKLPVRTKFITNYF